MWSRIPKEVIVDSSKYWRNFSFISSHQYPMFNFLAGSSKTAAGPLTADHTLELQCFRLVGIGQLDSLESDKGCFNYQKLLPWKSCWTTRCYWIRIKLFYWQPTRLPSETTLYRKYCWLVPCLRFSQMRQLVISKLHTFVQCSQHTVPMLSVLSPFKSWLQVYWEKSAYYWEYLCT